MRVLWFKVFYDLWANKARTIQVVLIIGIGAAAIGMIMGTRNLVVPGMQDMWQSIDPAMILLAPPPTRTRSTPSSGSAGWLNWMPIRRLPSSGD